MGPLAVFRHTTLREPSAANKILANSAPGCGWVWLVAIAPALLAAAAVERRVLTLDLDVLLAVFVEAPKPSFVYLCGGGAAWKSSASSAGQPGPSD